MIKLIVRGIRKLYFHIIKNFQSVITVNTDYGIFRIYTQDKIIGYSLYKDGQWEVEFPQQVFSFLKEKGIIQDKLTMIDLGANIGVTTIPYVRSGWVEKAIAVEADADNFKLLSENVILNNLSDSIFPLHYAVTESAAELVLEKSGYNFGDHRIKKSENKGIDNEHLRKTTSVKGDSLQNLVKLVPVDLTGKSILVWIDIQGHEGYCFRGAREWLIASKAPAVSEVWPYTILRSGMSLKEFAEIVSGIWSKYYTWHDKKFQEHPISEFLPFLEKLHEKDQQENIILIP